VLDIEELLAGEDDGFLEAFELFIFVDGLEWVLGEGVVGLSEYEDTATADAAGNGDALEGGFAG
jgi:deoxyribodipyrimidine photolyase-like uncharacterized protein